MMHIQEPDTRRFVAGGGGDRSVAARGDAIAICRNRHRELCEV